MSTNTKIMKNSFLLLVLLSILTACNKNLDKSLDVPCSNVSLTIKNKLDDKIENFIVNDIVVGVLDRKDKVTICLASVPSYDLKFLDVLFFQGTYEKEEITPILGLCGMGLHNISEGDFTISLNEIEDGRLLYD